MNQPPSPRARRPMGGSDRGSALVMAVFVLAFLSGVGLALAFLAQTEVRMNHGDLKSKRLFYLAEAGIESGREAIRQSNIAGGDRTLDNELVDAAGPDGNVDFDPATVRPSFSPAGEFEGLVGYGDDVPLVPLTELGEGWYAAFLTNDPVELGAADPLNDENDRVMVTAVGIDRSGGFQVVQATVEPSAFLPSLPPAAIVLLGPAPDFDDDADGLGWSGSSGCGSGSGGSGARTYDGNDCGGAGVPGMFVPTVGVVGPAAETAVENAMVGSTVDPNYVSGIYGDLDTVADLTDPTEPTVEGSGLGPLVPQWNDCQTLLDMLARLRVAADFRCDGPSCELPTNLTPSSVVFVEGDLVVPCDTSGQGLLVVTGSLDFPATASWSGMILVIGEGRFYRVGKAKDLKGRLSGATVVAHIAGPDEVLGTADDCTDGAGGFEAAVFREIGSARVEDTVYCTVDLNQANPDRRAPLEVSSFRQR